MSKHAIPVFLFVIILSGLGYCAAAQNETTKGKLELVQDPKMAVLIEKHIQLNAVLPGVMDGYRIQIYFDSGNESKKRAIDIRSDFLNRFPGVPAYLSFQEPFFKIRTGDFRSKLEADGFLQRILPVFPNAYIVRDRINYPRIETVEIFSNH